MNLDQFHDLKLWHQRHLREQPLEKHVWDMVLTFWLAGWVGAPAAFLIHAGWALMLCGALLFLPEQLRRRAAPAASPRRAALRLARTLH